MNYTTHEHQGHQVVALTGEVDLSTSPAARKLILGCLDEGRAVLVDLTGVSYIDSSGVASLVEAYQRAKDKALPFALVGVSAAALMVLQLARLDKVFPIYPDLADVPAHGG